MSIININDLVVGEWYEQACKDVFAPTYLLYLGGDKFFTIFLDGNTEFETLQAIRSKDGTEYVNIYEEPKYLDRGLNIDLPDGNNKDLAISYMAAVEREDWEKALEIVEEIEGQAVTYIRFCGGCQGRKELHCDNYFNKL